MKRFFLTGAVLILGVLVTSLSFAQIRATTTQTVTLAVNSIYRLSVNGSPSLTISDGTAGSGTLTSVSDNSSTYSLTTNQPVGRLSVQLGTGLGSGVDLIINVPSSRGTSAGDVPLGDGSSHDVVSSLTRGADNNRVITYTLTATAAATPFPATPYVVTWTLQE